MSALQARMLQIAGQDIPVQESDNSSSGSSDEEEVDKEEEVGGIGFLESFHFIFIFIDFHCSTLIRNLVDCNLGCWDVFSWSLLLFM